KLGRPLVYETRGRPSSARYLDVRLRGRASNRDGVGATVTIQQASGRMQRRVVAHGGVINTSAPAEAYFGLGDDPVELLDIRWPSGIRTQVANPGGGTLLVEEN